MPTFPSSLRRAQDSTTSVPGLEAGFTYYFFQRPTDDWPATPVSFVGDALRGSGTLLPGETHFTVSLDFPDLSQAHNFKSFSNADQADIDAAWARVSGA